MELFESLKRSGLGGNEARVYLEMIKRGSISANELAKKLSMDRTLVYQVLNNLVSKGLVSHIIKDGKKYFKTANPENLLNNLREKEMLIKTLIPELKKIEHINEESHEINVYEGKEGLRAFINLAMKEKELSSFGSTGRAFYALYEMPWIAKKVSASKTKVRIIGNEKYKGTAPFSVKNFQYKYLKVESEATTGVFGDYVSIHLIKGKPIIIIIKNKDIARSYKNYFDFMWSMIK